ncbi:polysaccharide deacetylase family protein [Porphyromonas gingivalis]|nr:hypothetical protein [Porphyromonas gingivalis]RRG13942.1 hypothetical protein DOE52_04315 [Porphyromonas gingivalis]GAP80642.1 hypothetical protein PGANDO_0107 [Porphyromonas gingivalis]
MKQILFTLDYELYGNGTGNVFEHIIKPTEELLAIARRHGIKYTIFFEVVEYWYLKREWERGNKMGYTEDPISAMEQQLREAYLQGHDVQLHLHPQWIGAVHQDGQWRLDLSNWCLGRYQGGGEYSLLSLLKRGKETIEEIIRPVDPHYSCIALRAGGYNAQPSEEIVRAMRQVGLKVDSSIYPGGFETGVLSNYDYTSVAPGLGHWYVEDRLEYSTHGVTDIMELPIVAFPIRRLQKYLSSDRIKALFQNRKSAADTYSAKTANKGGIWGKISYFVELEWQTWDFCLFSKNLHRRFLKRIESQRGRKEFVLVGHPKSYVSGESFNYLIGQLKSSYQFLSMTELYDQRLKIGTKKGVKDTHKPETPAPEGPSPEGPEAGL